MSKEESNIKKHHVKEVLNNSELSPVHIKLWILAGMGLFVDGFDLFIIAIALPLLIQNYPMLAHSPALQGLIPAAAPIGAILGAAVFGRFTDILGRKFIFIFTLIIFIVFSLLSAFSWSIFSLIVFRIVIGIGIGAEYPVVSSYVSEIIPKKYRKKFMIGNFIFQALGAITGAVIGLIILTIYPKIFMWRIMLGMTAVFSMIMFFFRKNMPESPRWLAANGYDTEAKATDNMKKIIGKKFRLHSEKKDETSFKDIFRKEFIKATILTAVPWFLMDIALYGIGIFTPIIIGTLFQAGKTQNFIQTDILHIKGTFFTELFLVFGILLAVLLVNKIGIIKMQILGFIGMSFGMVVLLFSFLSAPGSSARLVTIFAGFIIFFLAVNIGPNPMTYLIPTRVFPIKLKATGHGFAASCAKFGAAIGIFFLPIMKSRFGLFNTIFTMAVICFTGAIITAYYSKEIIKDKQNVGYKKLIRRLNLDGKKRVSIK